MVWMIVDKTVIVIVGATASGKTPIAIELAKKFQTEIISGDSRQCFKELNIGVARPSALELAEVRHHFIGSHSISDNVNAGTFESYALDVSDKLFNTHDVVVMAGGTGLYIKAFLEGMDLMPELPPEIRQRIVNSYNENGLRWLQEQVLKYDPAFYDVGEIQNPHRLMRALEVAESTGKSILEFRKGKKSARPFNVIKIGLELSKEELHGRIIERVDKMIEAGLINEVRKLVPYRHMNALQTVGYSEVFEYFDGKISLEMAIEEIKKNTRQYAKRQITWFKKDKEINWYSPKEPGKILRASEDALVKK